MEGHKKLPMANAGIRLKLFRKFEKKEMSVIFNNY